MFYLYPVSWSLLLCSMANYKLLFVLSVISELLNPFKYICAIYVLKVCIDMPKEIIKLYVVSK